MTRIVVVGAGGFGREVISTVFAHNEAKPDHALSLVGVVDDGPSEESLIRLERLGVPYLGKVEDFYRLDGDILYLLGVGTPQVRGRIAAKLGAVGRLAASVIHPRAELGSQTIIGDGSIVCAGVVISTNVVLGNHVHVNPNATIGHDTSIGDCVSINPGAIISGDVVIGRDVLVGAGATILQGLRIGARSIVGAAACVTRSVAPDITVKGVPARA